MNFKKCILEQRNILMEGALGERLKREYHLEFHKDVAMADLVYSREGKTALSNLWRGYVEIAKKYSLPFIATTPTRRANAERVKRSGYTSAIIRENVEVLRNIQRNSSIEMYIGGLMGCKGDAYTGEGSLSRKEAWEFHSWQAKQFQNENVDFLYAGIMPALPEAIGMAQAMSDTAIPYIISFTIQKDGKLIDGTTIHDAIYSIDNDDAVVNKPICYMTNCVHPKIVYEALSQAFNSTDLIRNRFWGIQANTSPLPYSELDGSKDLKSSDPDTLADDMLRLRDAWNLRIFGGCCGTDNTHMEAIAARLI
jgi:S-methylmethionine-dependent homocysteine/selenocysteine methylase